MGDIFVRRTTGLLSLLSAALAIACVALIAILVKRGGKSDMPMDMDDNRLTQTASVHSHDHHNPEMKMKTKTEMDRSKLPTPTERPPPWTSEIRIPRSTYPRHYDLYLYPNLDEDVFTGKVSILVEVTSPISYMVTHVKSLKIKSSKLSDSKGREVDLKDSFEYEPNQFWVAVPRTKIQPGNYTWTFDFSGELKGNIVGFYKSEYRTKDGETRAIATSKFQPTDARAAFPCFDEPSFKSSFSTTLVRPSQGYIALSNMDVESEVPDSPSAGLTEVKFRKSVPMVTYLACFIVCDFPYLETFTQDGKPFRVYATKDQVNRTEYARDIGVSILNYFEDYFEVKYPLPKQDQIAIPDFVSGAMEHWGLITYRETNLLYDDVESSSYNKQRVATVVSHELAHMWFGNLATLFWWDDLWLNEGFASYLEYKGVEQYEKDWDMQSQFVVADLQDVFKLDEIHSSHPIVQPVNHPDEITEIFDRISYAKGASVLRMLENFLGPEQFRMGVRNFLRRFSFKNAVTQDLWDDLQRVYDQMRTPNDKKLNVTRIMSTWTLQMGFPVLNVVTKRNAPDQVEVSQNRFLIDPTSGKESVSSESPFGYKWDIPVTYKTDVSERQQVWMHMEQDTVTISRESGSRWMKFNVDQFGYYRINYDQKMWEELIDLLKTNHQTLSPADRSSLIDDAFSLSAGGQLNYDTAFRLASYLVDETHYVPWVSASTHLQSIGELLTDSGAYKNYRKFVLSLVSKHVERVGWEDTGSHLERRVRIIFLSLACKYGHKGCMTGAKTRFEAWINQRNSVIPANLRTLVYKFGIQETGEYEWEILLERFMQELNAQEKSKMIYGLAATKEKWIANRLLQMAKNSTIIRKQDYFSLLARMATFSSSLDTVWNYIRTNYDWMVEEFGLNNRYLGRSIRSVGFKFTTPLQLSDLQAFFEQHPDAGSGKRAREQALEKINKNIQWVQTYAEQLDKSMKKLI